MQKSVIEQLSNKFENHKIQTVFHFCAKLIITQLLYWNLTIQVN